MPIKVYNFKKYDGFTLKTWTIIMAVFYIALSLVVGGLSIAGLSLEEPEHKDGYYEAFLYTLIAVSVLYLIVSVVQLRGLHEVNLILGCLTAHLVVVVIATVAISIHIYLVDLRKPMVIAIFMGKYLLFTIFFLKVIYCYHLELKAKEKETDVPYGQMPADM